MGTTRWRAMLTVTHARQEAHVQTELLRHIFPAMKARTVWATRHFAPSALLVLHAPPLHRCRCYLVLVEPLVLGRRRHALHALRATPALLQPPVLLFRAALATMLLEDTTSVLYVLLVLTALPKRLLLRFVLLEHTAPKDLLLARSVKQVTTAPHLSMRPLNVLLDITVLGAQLSVIYVAQGTCVPAVTIPTRHQ